VIAVQQLTKRYGRSVAVDHLSFTVEPGQITGFLGPNGAGKSTTMRLTLGLDRPDSGSALINGRPYRQLQQPLREIGALLDARKFHGGRSAFNHLLGLARTHGISRSRVQEVLALTGLEEVGHKSPGTYSLGMAQRLGVAAALLGDPPILILDEPMNGLDAEGMTWMRHLLQSLSHEGRTVFVSSHLMSEMAQLADRLVVIGRGKLVAETTVAQLVAEAGGVRIRIRTSDPERLSGLLKPRTTTVEFDVKNGVVTATGISLTDVGNLAAENQVVVYELTEEHPTLEEAFLRLTQNDVEYVGRIS
jgi:ABC-2 type transport system ATP-binding protein